MITKYWILQTERAKDLENAVNALLRTPTPGWQPYGGLVVAQRFEVVGAITASQPLYLQAMAFHEEKK